MKEKYFWATAVVIMLGIAYGAWVQKQNFNFADECTEIAREEVYTIYTHKAEGSFVIFPATTTYRCKDGRLYTR